MYTVRTNIDTLDNQIIETKSLPQNTVCKFMATIKEAREELENREMYKSIGMLKWYISNKQYDF